MDLSLPLFLAAGLVLAAMVILRQNRVQVWPNRVVRPLIAGCFALVIALAGYGQGSGPLAVGVSAVVGLVVGLLLAIRLTSGRAGRRY